MGYVIRLLLPTLPWLLSYYNNTWKRLKHPLSLYTTHNYYNHHYHKFHHLNVAVDEKNRKNVIKKEKRRRENIEKKTSF